MSSRQRKYQIEMRAQHRCIVCGGEEYVSCYCKKHYDQRMARIRELREPSKRCSLCSELGHNKRTCPRAPRQRPARKMYTCQNCQEPGHNKRTCPKQADEAA